MLWHWSQVLSPCPPLDAVWWDAGVVVVCQDQVWHIGDHATLLDAPPGARRVLNHDGQLWFWSDTPAWVAHPQAGVLPVPLIELTSLDVDADRVWAGSVSGAAVLEDGDWRTLTSGLSYARAGWVWTDGTLTPDGADPVAIDLPTWATVEATLTLDPDGWPTWSNAAGLWVLDAGQPRRLGDPARALAWNGAEPWIVRQGWGGPEQRAGPLPDGEVRLVSGPVVLAIVDDQVFRAAEGPAPPLVRADLDYSDVVSSPVTAVGDLDGDGWDDIATSGPGLPTTLWRQGPGGFQPWDNLPGSAVGITACDLDGDGRDELVVQQMDGPTWTESVWRFPARGPQPLAWPATTLEHTPGVTQCLDVDGDGDADVVRPAGGFPGARGHEVVVNRGLGRFHLERWDHDGWVAQTLFADLDADGAIEPLLLRHWGAHGLLDDGVDVTAGSGLELGYGVVADAAASDLDADGLLDLVVLYNEEVRVLQNQGALTFQDITHAAAPRLDGPWDPGSRLVDLDDDGVVELVLGQDDQWTVHAFDGQRFQPRQTGRSAGPPVAVDLEGDGDLDLVAPGFTLRNAATGSPQPTARWAPALRLRWLRPQDVGVAALVAGVLALAARRRRMLALGLGATGLAASLLAADAGVAWALAPMGLVAVVPLARRTGRDVAGYRLGRLLGAGGMGRVYQATAPDGDTVAVKLVNPELLTTADERARYRREAELGARVRHDRVVRILGCGEWTPSDGPPTAYLVMEFVPGGTVRQLLDQRGALPVAMACSVMQDVLQGLAAVHDQGIVHRDIKPENLCLDGEGRVKLMDFGAALTTNQATRTSRDVLGTLGYISPEQARGTSPTTASDVYACGVVLYELLAGRRPHNADDLVALIAAIMDGDVPPLPSRVPDAVADITVRALSPSVQDRPSLDQLLQAVQPLATQAPPAVRLEAPASPSRWSLLLRVLKVWRSHDEPGDVAGFAVKLLYSEEESSPSQGKTEKDST